MNGIGPTPALPDELFKPAAMRAYDADNDLIFEGPVREDECGNLRASFVATDAMIEAMASIHLIDSAGLICSCTSIGETIRVTEH